MEGGPPELVVCECVRRFGLSDKGKARAKNAREMEIEERVILGNNETFVFVVAKDCEPNNIDGISGR